MAYYGNYTTYPQIQTGSAAPQSYQTGLASYGGSSQAYRVSQPVYYAGPSYSTTSDNDYLVNSLPVAGYGTSAYGTGYGTSNIGSYGATNYASDPYAYSQPAQSGSYTQVNKAASGAELSQLAPQIEAAYEAATGQRRQPVIKRQVITIPGAPGRVQQIVRRLPTPTPDVVERVFVVKPQRDVVNLVIERPGTPPAQYKDRTIMGKPRKPLINPMVVRVQSRSQQPQLYYPSYQQYQPYVQALPAPSPVLNVQSVRVPPTASYQYSATPAPQTTSQTQQPSLSQARLSQASQSALQPQLSQPQLAKGFVVAPVQYDDQQQQQQQTQTAQQQAQAVSYSLSATQQNPAYTQASYATTPAVYGAGYSTGFPSQQFTQAYPSTPYPYARAY